MIVISNPIALPSEIKIIHSLFDEGLQLFHVRKPAFSEFEMAKYLHQIKLEHRGKLVLHQQHQIASDFGIDRKHFSESERKKIIDPVIPNMILSASTHDIEAFNALENIFEYAFLSPVFKSISKENYYPETNLFEGIKQRKNFNAKMIALGGIHSGNIEEILQKGFDNAALLGTIWNSNNAVKNFKSCQKIVLSFSA